MVLVLSQRGFVPPNPLLWLQDHWAARAADLRPMLVDLVGLFVAPVPRACHGLSVSEHHLGGQFPTVLTRSCRTHTWPADAVSKEHEGARLGAAVCGVATVLSSDQRLR